MAVLTREQRVSLFNQVKRRIESNSYQEGVAGNLMDAAEAVIEYYPVDAEDTVPEAEEVIAFLHEHLMLSRLILTVSLLEQPLFPVITLRMVAKIFGFGDPDEQWLNAVQLEAADLQSPKVMPIVWLCWLLKSVPDFATRLVKRFNELNNASLDLDAGTAGSAKQNTHTKQTPVINNAPTINLTAEDNANEGNDKEKVEMIDKDEDGMETDIKLRRDDQNNIVVTINGVTKKEGKTEGHGDDEKPQNPQGDAARKLTAITSAFRDRLFKGFDNQSIARHVHFFENLGRNLGMRGDHMANFFMNTLADPALTFFQETVREGMSYEEIKEMMFRQYNNPSRQSQMKRELDMLRMRKVMQESGIQDPLNGLDKVIRRICELSVQVHEDFRTDLHKIYYLSHAVAEYPWALTPIQNIEAMGYSFQAFCSALQSAIRTQAQIDLIRNERKATETHVTDTLVAQYARHPRSAHQLRQPRAPAQREKVMTFEEARRRGLCATCTGKWERGHRCPAGAIRSTVRHRIGNGENAIQIISDLVKGLEAKDSTHEDEPSETHAIASTDALRELDDQLGMEAESELDEKDATLTGHIMALTSPYSMDATPINEMKESDTGYTFPTSFVSNATNHTSMTFNMSPKHLENPQEFRPIGFCLDIGAPRSVTCQRELERIIKTTGIKVNYKKGAQNHFRFGNVVFMSIGTFILQLQTPKGESSIFVQLDIVAADVPALLGLDVMDAASITPCTVSNRLVKRVAMNKQRTLFKDLWSIKCVRASSNHMFAPIVTPQSSATHFTQAQLKKLHLQFFHPSPSKLFNVLEKGRPQDLSPKTLEALQEITKECETCQRIQTAPRRFKVSFGSNTARFNERIIIDVMYLDGAPVLHIVDEATHFSAAKFIPNISTKTVWLTILQCWAAIYTGMPHRILVDQGSCFGDSFMAIGAAHNVVIERTGVEAHSSLGIGERYHQPLRTTYRKLRTNHPNADKDLTLCMSVKAMNDTLGPEGLVPSLLVFGEYPEIILKGESPTTRPTTDERAALAQTARAEMERIMAQLRIQRALKHAVPPAHSQIYDRGDQVLIWRENVVAGRIGEWKGPATVIHHDLMKKIVHVFEKGSDRPKQFNAAQVKPFVIPPSPTEEHRAYIIEGCFNLVKMFAHPTVQQVPVFQTEIIPPTDPRASTKEMMSAIRKEVKGLMDRGTFSVVDTRTIPPGATILPCRFVLAIKSSALLKALHKARLVLGGHLDKLKALLVHSAQTVQTSSIKLLLAIAEMLEFQIWLTDIIQAYLQSLQKLGRAIYVTKVPAEFGLKPHQCLKVEKPIYGLSEAGDHWHSTLDGHHLEDLDMKPLKSDAALFIKRVNDRLMGLSGTYVDDILRAGTPEFRKLCQKTHEVFDAKEDVELPAEFTGFTIARDEKGTLILNQLQYLRQLEELPLDAQLGQFMSMRMKPAWLANTRPDCLLEISKLAQITKERFSKEPRECIKHLNRAVKYAIANRLTLRIPKLDVDSVRVVGFSDASFAGNYDLSSQLGFIVLLADADNKCVPILFKSYKARTVARSAMPAEVIAFSDMVDAAITFDRELEEILGRPIHLQLLTDSKCLFDVISKGSRTAEKRLMLDIAAARESFRVEEISDICLVRSEDNIADGLTKTMSQAALREVITRGRIDMRPVQSIIRDHLNTLDGMTRDEETMWTAEGAEADNLSQRDVIMERVVETLFAFGTDPRQSSAGPVQAGTIDSAAVTTCPASMA